MPSELPFVSCLCPTYLRSDLLANSIACFLAQDYPADRREMIILDDADHLNPQKGDGWEIVSTERRFRSLPEKFNAIAGLARGDVLVVWEDDDIYLPWHITAHVAALKDGGFSKPSRVLSLYTGEVEEEAAAGRFHASLAFTREAFDEAGGWPLTKRGDFDQVFIKRMSINGQVDTCQHGEPSYVFRWQSTGEYHGQAAMLGPDDLLWYDKVKRDTPITPMRIVPAFDAETAEVIAR